MGLARAQRLRAQTHYYENLFALIAWHFALTSTGDFANVRGAQTSVECRDPSRR
jgi:hypothetical protein